MAKRSRRPRLLKPEEITAVDVEEFCFAFAVGAAAYAYRMPMQSPSENRILLRGGQGQVQELRLTNIPLNRAAMAIREQCQGDPQKFPSIMHRIFGLMKLRSHTLMKKWTLESDVES